MTIDRVFGADSEMEFSVQLFTKEHSGDKHGQGAERRTSWKE